MSLKNHHFILGEGVEGGISPKSPPKPMPLLYITYIHFYIIHNVILEFACNFLIEGEALIEF